ncbi:MAG: DNA-binding protein WhiA [Synergistaceae bacterium]|nr:DNA-binding protein WhiA [Synergistaceae bacterium]
MDRDLWLSKLWDEWLMSPVRNADLEVSGLLAGMKHRNETFTTNRLRAARRLTGPCKYPLWPVTSYALTHTLTVSMLTRPNRKASVKFTCPPEILTLPENSNASWSWLKGLWGSTGGLYFPKSGYYLSLIISDAETSSKAREVLKMTGLSWTEHRNAFTLRNHDDITTFLYNAGMEGGALDFEGMALIRSARNRANLASNYDTANIMRSVRAANEQRRLAEKLISSGKFNELPEKLREVVELRIKFPAETLEGLGKRLNPPVGKSTVKYRWEKLRNIASKNSI